MLLFRYMTLTVGNSEIGVGPRRQQCTFWKSYLPKLMVASGYYFQNLRILVGLKKINVRMVLEVYRVDL